MFYHASVFKIRILLCYNLGGLQYPACERSKNLKDTFISTQKLRYKDWHFTTYIVLEFHESPRVFEVIYSQVASFQPFDSHAQWFERVVQDHSGWLCLLQDRTPATLFWVIRIWRVFPWTLLSWAWFIIEAHPLHFFLLHTSYTLPQTWKLKVPNAKFGSQSLKRMTGKRLGKDVSKLKCCGNVMHIDKPKRHTFSYVVIVHIKMFGPAVKHRISR